MGDVVAPKLYDYRDHICHAPGESKEFFKWTKKCSLGVEEGTIQFVRLSQ